jgi:hypothetical protein
MPLRLQLKRQPSVRSTVGLQPLAITPSGSVAEFAPRPGSHKTAPANGWASWRHKVKPLLPNTGPSNGQSLPISLGKTFSEFPYSLSLSALNLLSFSLSPHRYQSHCHITALPAYIYFISLFFIIWSFGLQFSLGICFIEDLHSPKVFVSSFLQLNLYISEIHPW